MSDSGCRNEIMSPRDLVVFTLVAMGVIGVTVVAVTVVMA